MTFSVYIEIHSLSNVILLIAISVASYIYHRIESDPLWYVKIIKTLLI